MSSFPSVQFTPIINPNEPSRTKSHRRSILMVLVVVGIVGVMAVCVAVGIGVEYNRRGKSNKTEVTIPFPASASALIKQYVETSLDPCDDFYEYACGGWKTQNEISQDKGRISTSQLIADRILNDVLNALNETVRNESSDEPIQKLAALHDLCLTWIDQNSDGSSLLEIIGNASQLSIWPATNADYIIGNITIEETMLHIWNHQHIQVLLVQDRGHESNTIHIRQPSVYDQLGLGYSAFYTGKFENVIDQYKDAMVDVATLLRHNAGLSINRSDILDQVENVYNMELEIAKISPSEYDQYWLRESGDPSNTTSVDDLKRTYGHFNWDTFLSQHGSTIRTILIHDINYFEALMNLLDKSDFLTITNYITWRVIHDNLFLTSEYRDIQDKISMSMSGATEMPKPGVTCLQYAIMTHDCYSATAASIAFGDGNSTETEVLEMAKLIEQTLNQMVDQNTRLDDNVKQRIKDRAGSITYTTGYKYLLTNDDLRSECRDVESTTVNINLVLRDLQRIKGNMLSYSDYRQEHQLTVANIYHRYIHFVNAHYLSHANEVELTAGILQPPLFESVYPASLKYGFVGSTIGHEIMHGFDPSSLRHDFDVYNTSTADTGLYDHATECIANQYKEYCKPIWSICTDPVLTRADNVADNGGVQLAYQAFIADTEELQKYPQETCYTKEKLFFIGYASFFCSKSRAQVEQLMMLVDEHSPAKLRVNAVVQNMAEFSTAFGCHAGKNMNPPRDRCQIWK